VLVLVKGKGEGTYDAGGGIQDGGFDTEEGDCG
jgi:hypothetical protein